MRRTKEDARTTKEDILNAAVEIFAAKGVAKTTLDEIACKAHVTRGAIYWHFKNKTEIFDALHERLHRPLVDMIMQDMEKDHPEPLQQLQDLCIKLLLDLQNNPQKKQALTLFLTKCDYSGDLAPYQEKHRAQKSESMKLFSRYFERAKKKHILPAESDPELLALSINCFLKGIAVEYLWNPESFHRDDRGVRLIRLFFKNMWHAAAEET